MSRNIKPILTAASPEQVAQLDFTTVKPEPEERMFGTTVTDGEVATLKWDGQ